MVRGMERWISKGHNPWAHAMCIDIGSSTHRSTSMIERVGTLTKTGCARHDYWCTTKGGPLDVWDMEALQGIYRGCFDYVAAGCSMQQYAGMLGNAIPWLVLAGLMPNALHASGLATQGERMELWDRAVTMMGTVW